MKDQPSRSHPVSFGKPKIDYCKRIMKDTPEKGKIGKQMRSKNVCDLVSLSVATPVKKMGWERLHL
jgi:hypothetical protein